MSSTFKVSASLNAALLCSSVEKKNHWRLLRTDSGLQLASHANASMLTPRLDITQRLQLDCTKLWKITTTHLQDRRVDARSPHEDHRGQAKGIREDHGCLSPVLQLLNGGEKHRNYSEEDAETVATVHCDRAALAPPAGRSWNTSPLHTGIHLVYF